MHEVQHAIPNEEELAAGGSRKLAYAALVSDAYEAVKDTPEFQSLQTKEERLHYLEEAAAKQAGVPFPVSWTVKMKKKQKETQDILSYHTQAAGCSDKARAKASGGRQPIEECGRTGL